MHDGLLTTVNSCVCVRGPGLEVWLYPRCGGATLWPRAASLLDVPVRARLTGAPGPDAFHV